MSASLGLLDGRFDLRRQVGAGAMGIVYEAWDRQTERQVAVKVLRGASARGAQRFQREGAILAELDHPAIVRYVTQRTSSRDESYLVMEWLEGETLENRLAAKGPLDIAEGLTLARRVVDGLAVAHRQGIVHRDLKPSNLFLPGGVVADAKILDFGVAWRAWDPQRRTETGAVLGTPLYMAPEQARGDTGIDERADIYSLGAVLFECFTGRAPFLGSNTVAILCKICLEDPPGLADSVAGAPAELDELLRRMLSKDASARPPDVATVARELANIQVSASPRAGERAPGTLTGGEQRVRCVILVGASTSTVASQAPMLVLPPLSELKATDEAIREVAVDHDAHVERLLDGSRLVTFPQGAGPADEALASARFAIALRARLRSAPIVVCTGRASTSERVPIGEVIDRGVSLLQASRTGSIRVDPITAGLLDSRFDIETVEEALYLRNEREAGEGARTVLGKVVACVGREPELALLEGVFAGAASDEEARAALVIAPPGAGKTRLRQELVRRLRQRADKFELILAGADSLRMGSPYALLAPSIRLAAGIGDDEPAEIRRQKLRTRVARHLPPEHAARVAEFLGELAGVPFGDAASPALRAARQDPRLMGDQMRGAWLDWLEAECAAQPVLLLLEDLHWSDSPSVQLVDSALQRLRERPLMVLGMGRPEVATRFPRLWEDCGLQKLVLAPLSRRASERLVAEILGKDMAPALVSRLVEQADGNPFFLEELLRGVALGQTHLPETVLGMLQTRIGALGGEAARVLRAASIFGERFRAQGVKWLLGEMGAPVVEESLRRMVEREVILRDRDPSGHDYAFRHALVRDASYATLTEDDRKLGHRLAAEWLESVGENDALVVADHFDHGGEPARAAVWYARAAEQALQADDLDAALARVARAAACGATGEALSKIRLVQAQALYWRGDIFAAAASAQEATTHAAPASAQWFQAIVAVVSPFADQGRLDDVVVWSKTAYEAAPATPDAAEAQIACLSWCGGALANTGRPALAAQLLERAEAALVTFASPEPWVVLRFHLAKGILFAWSGDMMEAISHLERALAAAELGADTRMICFLRCELGLYWTDLGEPQRGEPLLRQVIEEAKRRSLPTAECFTLPVLGHALLAMRRLDEARAVLERAREIASEQGSAWILAGADIVLSNVFYEGRDWAESERAARRAADALLTSPGSRPVALAALSRALLPLGRTEEAFEAASEAMSILESLGGTKDGESLVRLMVAETTNALGRQADARRAIASARDRVLERAAKITDTAVRRAFLERVADNARTLELANSWSSS